MGMRGEHTDDVEAYRARSEALARQRNGYQEGAAGIRNGFARSRGTHGLGDFVHGPPA